MTKTKVTSVIVVVVSLVVHLGGVLLIGLRDNMSTFDIVPLANSLRDIGLVAAILSGLVLIAAIIVDIVKSSFEKEGK